MTCQSSIIDRATGSETRCRKPSGHDGLHDDGCLQWRDRLPFAFRRPAPTAPQLQRFILAAVVAGELRHFNGCPAASGNLADECACGLDRALGNAR